MKMVTSLGMKYRIQLCSLSPELQTEYWHCCRIAFLYIQKDIHCLVSLNVEYHLIHWVVKPWSNAKYCLRILFLQSDISINHVDNIANRPLNCGELMTRRNNFTLNIIMYMFIVNYWQLLSVIMLFIENKNKRNRHNFYQSVTLINDIHLKVTPMVYHCINKFAVKTYLYYIV